MTQRRGLRPYITMTVAKAKGEKGLTGRRERTPDCRGCRDKFLGHMLYLVEMVEL